MSKDLQVIEPGAPSLVIDNTLTVDKREIIDLMIFEKEEMLQEEDKALEEENKNLNEEIKEEANKILEESGIKKQVQKTKKQLRNLLSSIEDGITIEEELCYTYGKITGMKIYFHKSKSGPDTSGTLVFDLPKDFLKKLKIETEKREKKQQIIQKRRGEISEEMRNLPKKAKELRSKALKKALENSEEGQKILSYFRELRSSK